MLKFRFVEFDIGKLNFLEIMIRKLKIYNGWREDVIVISICEKIYKLRFYCKIYLERIDFDENNFSKIKVKVDKFRNGLIVLYNWWRD